jgi:starch synthase (maltosyl-transferring)
MGSESAEVLQRRLESPGAVAFPTPRLQAVFSKATGSLEQLTLRHEGVRLASSPSVPGLDVRLKDGWLGRAYRPTLLEAEDGPAGLTLHIRLGPVIVRDHYAGDGERILRRVQVENATDEEIQLTGVRLFVPGVAIGRAESCRFEAPGTAVRPRLPLPAVPTQQPDASWDAAAAPGAITSWLKALGDAPDVTPGLVAVHHPDLAASLLVWYHSEIEAATPLAFQSEAGIVLGHEIGLAGWLRPGQTLDGGTQFIEAPSGDWPAALKAFGAHYRRVGILPPLYVEPPDWVRRSVVYEAHPGPFGGFRGLAAHLPGIADMGFTVLYLMPVMRFDNRSGMRWDENWIGSGSPYAMLDFEDFEPSLGTEAEFIELVEGAHRLGLRVLMDFVPQGCALEARYVQEHPEWFCRDEEGSLISSHGWNDTYSIDWANPEYQAYMVGWASRFLTKYGIDGFRVDAPHGKEPNWARGLPYHASFTSLGVLRLLEDLQRTCKRVRPDSALLCELFGPVFVRSHDFQYDYLPWAMSKALLGGLVTAAEWGDWMDDYWAVQPEGAVRLCFTETHDTRTGTDAYALRGSMAERAMFGLLVLSGFVPMVWAGQEEGLEGFYRRVLRARRASEAILFGRRSFQAVPCDHDNVVSVLRRQGDEIVWGVVSLRPERTPLRFDFRPVASQIPKEFSLHDRIAGEDWDEHGRRGWRPNEGDVTLSLRPFVPYFFRMA